MSTNLQVPLLSARRFAPSIPDAPRSGRANEDAMTNGNSSTWETVTTLQQRLVADLLFFSFFGHEEARTSPTNRKKRVCTHMVGTDGDGPERPSCVHKRASR